MSDKGDWSSQYVAWKLFELVLEAEQRKPQSMTRDEILGLFTDCVSAAEGSYTGDLDLSDFDDDSDLDDDDDGFDDEDEDEDEEDDDRPAGPRRVD